MTKQEAEALGYDVLEINPKDVMEAANYVWREDFSALIDLDDGKVYAGKNFLLVSLTEAAKRGILEVSDASL